MVGLASENYGLVLASMNGVNNATFTSSDGVAPSLHPRLTVTFACECASACIPPQGSGAILFVVDKENALQKEEKARKATFESWGYTVSPIEDKKSQAIYDARAALHDLIYVSEHAEDIEVGTKLTNLSIGVVNEEGKLNDELGIASGEATAVGSSITILDTSHYISQLFPAGALKIYAADMEGLTVTGTEAPGLQTLGDWGGVGGLVVYVDNRCVVQRCGFRPADSGLGDTRWIRTRRRDGHAQ